MARHCRKSRHWRCKTEKHYQQAKSVRAYYHLHPGPKPQFRANWTISQYDPTNLLLDYERIREEFEAQVRWQMFQTMDRAMTK